MTLDGKIRRILAPTGGISWRIGISRILALPYDKFHLPISPIKEEGVEKRFDVSPLMSDGSASSVVGLALILPSVFLMMHHVKRQKFRENAKVFEKSAGKSQTVTLGGKKRRATKDWSPRLLQRNLLQFMGS